MGVNEDVQEDAESIINDLKDAIDELETLSDENRIDCSKQILALRDTLKNIENEFELEESEESESDEDDD